MIWKISIFAFHFVASEASEFCNFERRSRARSVAQQFFYRAKRVEMALESLRSSLRYCDYSTNIEHFSWVIKEQSYSLLMTHHMSQEFDLEIFIPLSSKQFLEIKPHAVLQSKRFSKISENSFLKNG